MLGSYRDRSRLIKKVIFWAVITGGVLALLFVQTVARADTKPIDPCDELGGCITGIQNYSNAKTSQENIVSFVLTISRFLIYLAGAIAVLYIVLGGYYMITSNGNDAGYKKGLNTLLYAILGLIVAIISVTIVNIISGLATTDLKIF